MLYNQGLHPFLEDGEPSENLKNNILNARRRRNPEDFSPLAEDLFSKMTFLEPSQRYTIDEVAQHPWITRDFNTKIPLTSNETVQAFQQQYTLKKVYLVREI
jgi:serine/threonine protein kinase